TGLLVTPEERTRPRPLLRVAECSAFDDLMPVPASVAQRTIEARLTARHRGLRFAQAGLMAAAALVALALPRSGIAPELSPDWHAQLQLAAYANDAQATTLHIEAPPRKRLIARERPARMIDDALRRRALQAVQRALA